MCVLRYCIVTRQITPPLLTSSRCVPTSSLPTHNFHTSWSNLQTQLASVQTQLASIQTQLASVRTQAVSELHALFHRTMLLPPTNFDSVTGALFFKLKNVFSAHHQRSCFGYLSIILKICSIKEKGQRLEQFGAVFLKKILVDAEPTIPRALHLRGVDRLPLVAALTAELRGQNDASSPYFLHFFRLNGSILAEKDYFCRR